MQQQQYITDNDKMDEIMSPNISFASKYLNCYLFDHTSQCFDWQKICIARLESVSQAKYYYHYISLKMQTFIPEFKCNLRITD
jgi:hypothetical protein